ncbi:MAG: metallophosphoesterase family protein [Leptolyngbya sp. SIO4C5]|nr:metallophosphoesterase family protein [Leptolyngbya sp. SIO4C5]
MNIAVLSCIHGNLEALAAVLQDIDRQDVDQIYCLGDLVGYGPYPNEVVVRIRELEIPTCQGCWDEDIVDGLNACECSYPSLLAENRGRLAHEWTNREVTPETRAYLASLPLTLHQDTLCFVHGSPHSQHEYLLPDTSAFIAMERVLATGADTLFCGHTHVPYVRNLENSHLTLKVASSSTVRLSAHAEAPPSTHSATPLPALKRIINAGSVGEPRHGRPSATYVIYNPDTQQAELREIEYDYTKTCAAILEKGLPAVFAWRLSKGLEYAEKADDPSHVCER